ncbi:MAG: hypothetical protein H6667_10045 [Ardenticatenaceae bacterium]|nr:hypothetical protein [Ardenticatenaceae bacterium]MCB9446685.1 hypothetical protein [Ardenticatenaceae bacterium]
MARTKAISDDVREQVIVRVEAFNQANVSPAKSSAMAQLLHRLGVQPQTSQNLPQGSYVPRFQGAYLYLDRIDFRGQLSKICRLKWAGSLDDWKFAIYRYSRDAYDPDEWFFPGAEEVDGTIEGAMRAGIKAYPD